MLSAIIYYVVLCVWVFSLTIMFSGVVHIAECISMYQNVSFLKWLSNTLLCIYTIFTHSLVGGCLGGYHLLDIINNAAINIQVQVFVRTYVFIWVTYIRVELMGYNGNSMFNGLRTCQTVFQSRCTILDFHKQSIRLLISSDPRQHFLLSFFEYCHPGGYEMIFCCGSDLHLPRN